MKKLRLLAASLLLATGAISMASCSTNSGSKYVVGQKVKVGLICLHNEAATYDKNFIDAWKEAFQNNDKVTFDETCIKTDIEENNDCYEAAKALVKQGCNMIFADSFGHGAYIKQAAEEFPNVQFCHATGTGAYAGGLNNLHDAFASIYAGRYVAGVAAGYALENKGHEHSETIKAGYVGAYNYAEIKSGYTAWYLGLRSVFPLATMDVRFTKEWYDETAERETANTLITDGAIVISQHADSMGAPNACQNSTNKILNVPYNISTESSCSDTYVAHSSVNWAPYFESVIDAMYSGRVIDSEFSRNWVGGFATDSVKVGFTSNRSILTEDNVYQLNQLINTLETYQNPSEYIFDTDTFTLEVTDTKNATAKVDSEGHLTSYKVDIDGDGTAETESVLSKNGNKYFAESEFRSAPYFALDINGITLK